MLKTTAIIFYILVVFLFAPFSDKYTEPYKLLPAWVIGPEFLVLDLFDLSQERLSNLESNFIEFFSLVSSDSQPVPKDHADKEVCNTEDYSVFF